jgi:hypothetical protein
MVFDAETVIEANSVAHLKFAPQLLVALVGVHSRLTPEMRKMREFHCANLPGARGKSEVVKLTSGRLTHSFPSMHTTAPIRNGVPTTYKVSPLAARFNNAPTGGPTIDPILMPDWISSTMNSAKKQRDHRCADRAERGTTVIRSTRSLFDASAHRRLMSGQGNAKPPVRRSGWASERLSGIGRGY